MPTVLSGLVPLPQVQRLSVPVQPPERLNAVQVVVVPEMRVRPLSFAPAALFGLLLLPIVPVAVTPLTGRCVAMPSSQTCVSVASAFGNDVPSSNTGGV